MPLPAETKTHADWIEIANIKTKKKE